MLHDIKSYTQIYKSNPVDPVGIWPEPDLKKSTGSTGTGTGFPVAHWSCTTQLIDFCDSFALSLNDNIRFDVIYFDFANAFDSINHDIILSKLKTFFQIDGNFEI